jgi:hypothetical protein
MAQGHSPIQYMGEEQQLLREKPPRSTNLTNSQVIQIIKMWVFGADSDVDMKKLINLLPWSY